MKKAILSLICIAISLSSCDFDDVKDTVDDVKSFFCGDGIVGTNEECDDGNTANGDGCSSTCKKEASSTPTSPICGNKIVETGEGCDDGNTVSGDGCSSSCQVEQSQPVQTDPVCGNGIVESGEDCDDGNLIYGDGCSPSCKKEPSATTPVCGNGKRESGEECDDGNTASGDGCSASCKKESTSSCPNEGDTCSGNKSMCCGNNVYDCVNNHYEIIVCKGNAYCDSADGFYDCVEPCTSKEAKEDFIGYDDYCDNGEFELFACQKGDSGKYGIFGGYYAKGYCWEEGTILECDDDGTVGEFECNVCIEGEGDDPYTDICQSY